MDINKLETLLKKVNQAVNTIKTLKDREKKYLQVIDSLKADNAILKEGGTKLQEENARLNAKVTELTSELTQNEGLQNELEDKIIAMLNSLPDEDGEPDIDVSLDTAPVEKVAEEVVKEESVEAPVEKSAAQEPVEQKVEAPVQESAEAEEREEEIIKNFLNEQEEGAATGLFNEEVVVEEPIPQSLEQNEAEEPGEFNNLLFSDSEQESVSFDFKADDVVHENNELPKGVL